MNQLKKAQEHSPVVVAHQAQRASEFQLRIADKITAFAGSMNFVHIHTIVFAVWMVFIESSPWPTLTLIVSLEAIYLSTLVLIGQYRQSAFQQPKADRDFHAAEQELDTNTELTRTIHVACKVVHRRHHPGKPSCRVESPLRTVPWSWRRLRDGTEPRRDRIPVCNA